jgi:hypothetical protein
MRLGFVKLDLGADQDRCFASLWGSLSPSPYLASKCRLEWFSRRSRIV